MASSDHRPDRGTKSILPVRVIIRSSVLLIRIYQRVVSPLLPSHCRFTPTCSEYAAQSLLAHGLFRGGLMTVKRLLRCHPGHPGGWDLVPPPEARVKGRENGQADPLRHTAGHGHTDHLSVCIRTQENTSDHTDLAATGNPVVAAS